MQQKTKRRKKTPKDIFGVEMWLFLKKSYCELFLVENSLFLNKKNIYFSIDIFGLSRIKYFSKEGCGSFLWEWFRAMWLPVVTSRVMD